MITVKFIEDGEIHDYQVWKNTSARTLRQSIYWLLDLRKTNANFLEVDTRYESWIEIDGFHVPDSVLFMIDKEEKARKYLANLRDHLAFVCSKCGHKLG